MKDRILWLDNVRAFAIILVVLGHVLQYIIVKDSYKDDMAFNIIYSFHMALFMMISGSVIGLTSYKRTYNLRVMVKKKLNQLLLPFFSWTIIYTIIKGNPIHILESVIYPAKSLWFLWALFCISTVFSFIREVTKGRWAPIWGGYSCLS